MAVPVTSLKNEKHSRKQFWTIPVHGLRGWSVHLIKYIVDRDLYKQRNMDGDHDLSHDQTWSPTMVWSSTDRCQRPRFVMLIGSLWPYISWGGAVDQTLPWKNMDSCSWILQLDPLQYLDHWSIWQMVTKLLHYLKTMGMNLDDDSANIILESITELIIRSMEWFW